VRAALDASAFNWSAVPTTVTIHLSADADSRATPGQIWLDANLVDAGVFSWGVIQHEYAHQVDFLLLDDALRAELLQRLGGKDWCYDVPGLDHASYGCERFASTLAWSYWQSDDNSLAPTSAQDESAAMRPAAFRALLEQILASSTAVASAEIRSSVGPARAPARASARASQSRPTTSPIHLNGAQS
jgi:hypothetical protein